jgi:hypothetical protein
VAAASVARERNQRLIVVNSSRGDALADPGFAQPADLDWASATMEGVGVEFTIRQSSGPRARTVRDANPPAQPSSLTMLAHTR